MSKYYVVDSTKNQNGKNPVVLFESTAGVVKYLDGMCLRKFQQTRKNYMENVESLGFGADEATGQVFYEQMSQYFNMGMIRSDSTPVRCNIFEASHYGSRRAVHGD
jgi:hypothetical protein